MDGPLNHDINMHGLLQNLQDIPSNDDVKKNAALFAKVVLKEVKVGKYDQQDLETCLGIEPVAYRKYTDAMQEWDLGKVR